MYLKDAILAMNQIIKKKIILKLQIYLLNILSSPYYVIFCLIKEVSRSRRHKDTQLIEKHGQTKTISRF